MRIMTDKNTRKKAFTNFCDYCGIEFKTSMPFAKFCSNNHRKYFANCKRIYEKTIQQKAIEQSDNLISQLLKISASKNISLDEVVDKINNARKQIEAYTKIKDNIDNHVKEFIKNGKKSKQKKSK